jgi:hypothetical protein
MNLKLIAFTLTFFSIAFASEAQNVISGIVVDSLSLTALPGVHIKVKNSERITVSHKDGSFVITAADYDTLIFTFVGYRDFEYALFGPESDILIRMREDVVILKEVTVTASPMVGAKGKYQVSDGSYIKAQSLAESISSPFTYLSRYERDKRKLLKLREENKKIKTYVEVVNDRDYREELMMKFSLTEKEYYDLLARFNQLNRQNTYIVNPDEIKKRLFNFIQNSTR